MHGKAQVTSMSSASEQELERARLERAKEVIRLEARTIARLESTLNGSFSRAVGLILACKGKLVVTGMGKAGLIAQKVSATFASTGTDSIFLHPAEAQHGDLGRIRPGDLVLALSNSGETNEIKVILGPTRKLGAGLIAITGGAESTLAQRADCVLDIGKVDEACPMGLAPTASTSAMLALGDALAMVVLQERSFSREDYALFHPAGSLGRRLMKVSEIMRKGVELPLVGESTSLADTLGVMGRTPGRPGAALVVDEAKRLAGIFTDGDLRRLVLEHGEAFDRGSPIARFMHKNPKFVRPDQLVEEAERLLHEFRIDQIPVLDADSRPVGLLDVQDVLDTRL
ncbi:MAG: KpsF/GutQ family sugar-phosphate isomerase [Planctomycetes bacterium]|nr:KpsF/GutQ family sugar-phosphate isomerase [Planctomycetota bacterium]